MTIRLLVFSLLTKIRPVSLAWDSTRREGRYSQSKESAKIREARSLA